MSLRLSKPWAALVIVLLAAFAYSVAAQSIALPSANRLVVKAVPEGKDLYSFSVDFGAAGQQDFFTVPQGAVFIVTDAIHGPVNAGFTLRLRAGTAGAIRSETRGAFSLRSGIRFNPGETITVEHAGGDLPVRITISGYIADAF